MSTRDYDPERLLDALNDICPACGGSLYTSDHLPDCKLVEASRRVAESMREIIRDGLPAKPPEQRAFDALYDIACAIAFLIWCQGDVEVDGPYDDPATRFAFPSKCHVRRCDGECDGCEYDSGIVF